VRDHNWSFAAWEIAKLDNRVRERSLVVHVDAHLDDVPDGVLVDNLQAANTLEEILNVSRGNDYINGVELDSTYTMGIDNFIWASLARKTIEDVIYVSNYKDEILTLEDIKDENTQLSRLILSKLPNEFRYQNERFRGIAEFLNEYNKDTFRERVGDRSAILDLDIDIFNESDDLINPVLTPMFQVREYVERLLALYPWDLITIAISPVYCGGSLEAELVLDNVLKATNIDTTKISNW
jgi:hypothetical protein